MTPNTAERTPLDRTDAEYYMKLNYHAGLSSTEETIIFNQAMNQIKNEPKVPTLLKGDIL